VNNIYGIVLKEEGKVYYFNGKDMEIESGKYVVVNTDKGIQLGKVIRRIDENKLKMDINDLKNIERIASDEDYDTYLKNLSLADKALKKSREIVQELGIEMNIIDVSYTLDKKQLLFNFVADERVDFRELAKKLASIYKTRIELRQIGARDKARMVCGIGQCGRTLCCSTFLSHIDSVTMNMAKNQNIALNPSKINGLCGRLLCCLTYEDEEYTRCQFGMPSVGQTIKSEYGMGKVVSVDVLKRRYKIDVDGVIREIVLDNDDSKK